jgi:hypothetical protein
MLLLQPKGSTDTQKLLDAERALIRELEERAHGSDRELSDMSKLRETMTSLESSSYNDPFNSDFLTDAMSQT